MLLKTRFAKNTKNAKSFFSKKHEIPERSPEGQIACLVREIDKKNNEKSSKNDPFFVEISGKIPPFLQICKKCAFCVISGNFLCLFSKTASENGVTFFRILQISEKISQKVPKNPVFSMFPTLRCLVTPIT